MNHHDSTASKSRHRTEESLLGTPSAISLSHSRTQRELARQEEPEKPFEKITTFLKIRVFGWVWHYVKSRFGPRVAFQTYDGKPDNGVYTIPAGPTTIALASDWASGTEVADWVGKAMEASDPDYTIHLGDIYYVGTQKEIDENMLGGITQWPMGSAGSFALNANHEMYARGKWYFKGLLPKLGPRENGEQQQQHASYFCLRNDHWLILGLDTGYHSVGFPVLEMLVKPSARLDDRLVDWLRDEVRLQDDESSGLVILTHHQYFSKFEKGFDRAARQLSELVKRPVIWFWGHEHRLALYGKSSTKKGANLEAFGRCIGHGGLPMEDIDGVPESEGKDGIDLVAYDRRRWKTIGKDDTPIGFNGFALLKLDGERLTIEHWDVNQSSPDAEGTRLLVTEEWRVGPDGRLQGLDAVNHISDTDLVVSASGIRAIVGL